MQPLQDVGLSPEQSFSWLWCPSLSEKLLVHCPIRALQKSSRNWRLALERTTLVILTTVDPKDLSATICRLLSISRGDAPGMCVLPRQDTYQKISKSEQKCKKQCTPIFAKTFVVKFVSSTFLPRSALGNVSIVNPPSSFVAMIPIMWSAHSCQCDPFWLTLQHGPVRRPLPCSTRHRFTDLKD